MSSTFRLGQVVKCPFLMACSKVFFTGIKRAEWYHLDSSVFLLASRALSAAVFLARWSCGVTGKVELPHS